MMAKSDHKPEPPDRPFVASDQGSDEPAELARITERNRLIVQIMEIDAKRRHLESLQSGLQLEVHRLKAAADAKSTMFAAELKEVDDQLRRLASQRTFLASSLAEIDGAVPPKSTSGQGHA